MVNAGTSALGLAFSAALAGIAPATCYTQIDNIPCCDLRSGPALRTYNCANDSNCKDSATSSGNVSHYKTDAPKGASGRTGLAPGASCTCIVQRKKCSNGGYCVNDGPPNDPDSIQSEVPGGDEACTVPESGGGGSPD